MFKKAIQPSIEPIIVNGRVMYDEKSHAYSIIRLKKRIIEEFPQLTKKCFYQLEFFRSYPEIFERIEQIRSNQEGLPFLLFVYGEENEQ